MITKPLDLLLGVFLFICGHFFVFYQLNGQFIWKSFVKHEWAVAAAGFFISFMFMWGTKYTISGTGDLLWPARFIGFGCGMVIYALLVSYHFNEGINMKTVVSLLICAALIGVQLFWK